MLDELINNNEIPQIKVKVEDIKVNFYKKHQEEIIEIKKKFISEGGDNEDFKPTEDVLETKFKELYKKFKELKALYNKKIEEEKELNLQSKYQIIEEIKNLINRKEAINKTFQDFRDLQNRWREIGLVPQNKLKNLWETYHHHVEKFYDYININKELRDLDLKKNFDFKIKLCEKAEQLILEQSVIQAFNTLQKYHEQWRETGPVPHEKSDELWERFREATSKINKKHQEHYENIKKEQIVNLSTKTILCEKIEELNKLDLKKPKKWEEKSKEIIEIQKLWKSIGFAPKNENNKIYKRFKDACDIFFSKKRDFYNVIREEQNNNLQLKTDLCVQAEAFIESTEWRETTEDLINIQKKWKEIGPVPRKYSNELWKRFRTACDVFFNNKSEYFSKVDSQQEVNLKLKNELIDLIENFQPSDNKEEDLKKIINYQNKWAEIGYIPIKLKEDIQNKFRNSIAKQFDKLEIDEAKRSILIYKNKVGTIFTSPKNKNKVIIEKNKIINNIKNLKNEIALFENNIGFFAKSKNADELIKNVNANIKNAQEKLAVLQEKLKILNSI